MRWSWFADFFSALPDALKALYDFGDPQSLGNGWWGFLILVLWGVFLTAIPAVLAKRWYGEREWMSASMGVIAATSVSFWVFGIVPSAWIYYVDSNKEILEHDIIPSSLTITIGNFHWDLMSNFYDVVRDSVVMLETTVATAAMIVVGIKIQEKYPRTLAPGEVKPDAGGYK